jgi:uncharacterized membrane protein
VRAIRDRFGTATSSVVLSVLSLVLLLGVLLLPDLAPVASGPQVVHAWHGRITALLDPRRPDPSAPGGGFLPDARVLLLEGPDAGTEVEAYRQGPGGQQDSNAYRGGEDVVVTATDNPDGAPFVAIADRWRLPQLAVLAGVFVAAVVLVGGWRGLRALLGLALTIAILLRVLIPLLVAGVPPIPVAVVIATCLTILVIGLTEGLGRASVAAILGTSAALALTAILAAVVTAVAGFTNTLGSELVGLQLPNGQGLDLRGMLLAAFMVGSIGVLDDVTVTQAVAVEELARVGLRGRPLYASAFSVGRSHIAATVNTLFLAYAGASLPLLVFLAVGNQPTTLLINGESISIEIVRTLVGSLGIVAAVPLTTLIAAWLTGYDEQPASRAAGVLIVGGVRAPLRSRPGRPSPLTTLVVGLIAVAVATIAVGLVLGPLTSTGSRVPLAPEAFGSPTPESRSGEPAASGPSESPLGGSPGPSAAGVPEFAVGDAIPLFGARGDPIGDVTVLEVDPQAGTGGGGIVLDVKFRYSATAPLAIDPGAWLAQPSESAEVAAATPADTAVHPAIQGQLGAGQTRIGWLEFTLPEGPASLSLAYGPSGMALFSVLIY